MINVNKTEEIIAKQLEKIPPEVKSFYLSAEYAKAIQEIIKKQRLLIDQGEKLETETTLVMIGLEPLSDYVKNLETNLELNPEKARLLAIDINELVFKKIRQALQKMDEDMLLPEEINPLMPKVNIGPEEANVSQPARLTNTSSQELNRDQILNEIENPIPNRQSTNVVNTKNPSPEEKENKIEIKKTQELEIRPDQEIQTVPGEGIKDIVTAKMTGPTVTTQGITEIKKEVKLPEIEKRPYKGNDPYLEPIA